MAGVQPLVGVHGAPEAASRAATPAILARGVVRVFGKVRALSGLDLSVPSGELYGLVGPNASGKTTLIRILMGLDKATSGAALIHGDAPRAHAAQLGYMPQEEALYPDLSVLENVEFFAGLYTVPDVEARARSVLDLVHLWDDRRRPVGDLSGGMRRRVSLAVALAHEPSVLFLDEPTVGVDPLLRAEFWDHFHALARQGAAILITTHHLEEARRCDRVGFLWEGRVLREGNPERLLEASGATSLEGAFLYVLREAGIER